MSIAFRLLLVGWRSGYDHSIGTLPGILLASFRNEGNHVERGMFQAGERFGLVILDALPNSRDTGFRWMELVLKQNGGKGGGKADEPGWAAGLRQLYNSVVDEPLPSSFDDLLKRFDAQDPQDDPKARGQTAKDKRDAGKSPPPDDLRKIDRGDHGRD